MKTTNTRFNFGFPRRAQTPAPLRYLALLTAFVLLCTFPLSTPAKDPYKGVRDWLVIPVFYATNRVFVGQGGAIEYSEAPNKKLLFGVKNIVVPVPAETTIDATTEQKMDWQKISLAPKDKEGPPAFNLDRCKIKDSQLERDQVTAAFKAYMDESGNSESVLFVHGCCINFDTAMRRSADLAATMHTPVLLYDWVSPRKFRNYLVNGTRADQTMDDFCKFLTQVEKVAEPHKVVLVAHSLGNQFLDEAMIRRFAHYSGGTSAPPKFNEIVLSNADVDAQSFLNHASQVVANADKVRVYFNQTDPRLKLSTWVHGGFRRLGSPGDLITPLTQVQGLQLIDVAAAKLGHEMPYWLVADVHRRGNLASSKDFKLGADPAGFLSLEKIETPRGAVEASAGGANRPQ
jgi:esterase/lipase superfamily enzyme